MTVRRHAGSGRQRACYSGGVLNPGDRIGDWEIVLPLGQGGMGSVYRCRHALTERIEAAVKVLQPTDREGARERFIREAEALHALKHPAIVRIGGFGLDAGTGLLWIAMDLVQGENFERLLQRGQFPRDRVAGIFGPVADGLAYAHSRGIVHRDIKPGNLMLQSDGSPVLLDFGIAVQEGQDRLTREGIVPGTVAYAAPEQVVAGNATDPALADVYALGQVLNECLIGAFTFPRRAGMDLHRRSVRILRQKLKAEPLDPGPGYSRHVRELVRQATDPDPERRGPPLSEWASILASGSVMEEETVSLAMPTPAALETEAVVAARSGPVEASGVAAGGAMDVASGEPAPSSDPGLARVSRPRRSGAWIGITAVAVVLLGGVLLSLTAVGAVAAWWSLSSTPPPPVTGIPLGEVLVVDEPPPAPPPEPDEIVVAEPLAAPVKRPRPTSSGSPGRLVLASSPVAAVTIDGEARRRTPLSLDVAPGRHEVELRTADGRSRSFGVEVETGEKVRRMWSFDEGEWRSFEGGLAEAGLPTRPSDVGEATSRLRALPDTDACLGAAGEVGPVTVVFTVAPDGSVVAEGLRDPALRGTPLEACLERAARRLEFSPSVAGAAVSVRVGG